MGSLLSSFLSSASPSVSNATQTEWSCPGCRSLQNDAAAVPCGHQCCLGCLLRRTATSPTCPVCCSPVLGARFSVQGRDDFLQCILIPPGEPPGPATWAPRALFRLVYTRPSAPEAAPAPAEPTREGTEAAEKLPADMWAELLHGHDHLLDPVRPWLRQSLDAIYGPQWWEARQVESIALSTLCICGPDRDGLTDMLQPYLGEYTAPLIRGLIHVTLHRCRDPWLQRRSRAAPEEVEDESLAASAGLSSSGGTPGLAAGPASPSPASQNPPAPRGRTSPGPCQSSGPCRRRTPRVPPCPDGAGTPGPGTAGSLREGAPRHRRHFKVRRRKPRRK